MPTRTTLKPTHEEIALVAYQYWLERGDGPGSAEQDWLQAEQDLEFASSTEEDGESAGTDPQSAA